MGKSAHARVRLLGWHRRPIRSLEVERLSRHPEPPRHIAPPPSVPHALSLAGVVLLATMAAALIFLPVVTLPSDIGEYDQKRLAQFWLLAIAGLCCGASSTLRKRASVQLSALPRAVWIALGVVLLLGVASSWRSASPRDALAELSLMLALVFLAVTLAAALRPVLARFRTLLAGGVLVMLGLYLLQTAVRYAAWRFGGAPFDLVEMLTGLGHQRFVNQWQTLTLPLAVLPVLVLRSPWWRAIGVLAAALWWALVIGAGARGTTLGVGVAILLTPLLAPKARTWSALQLLCAGLGFVLAMSLFPQQLPERVDGVSRLTDVSVTANSNESRLVLWVEAADLILEHPVLGIGPMHFAAVGERAHPHNLALQLAVEWGLPATLLLIALALGAARAWLSMLPAARNPQVVRAALTASFIAAAVHSMVSGITVPAYTQLWLAFLAGLALCEFHEMLDPYGLEGESARRPTTAPTRLGVGLVVGWVACVGMLGTHVVRDLPGVGASQEVAMARQAGAAPRFWRYGYIGEERGLAALLDPERPLTPRPRYTLEAALERADLPFLSE